MDVWIQLGIALLFLLTVAAVYFGSFASMVYTWDLITDNDLNTPQGIILKLVILIPICLTTSIVWSVLTLLFACMALGGVIEVAKGTRNWWHKG